MQEKISGDIPTELSTVFATSTKVCITDTIENVRCGWCSRERKDGEKWMDWCCREHGYAARRKERILLQKQQEMVVEKRTKYKRSCLMCGKKDLETWFCEPCRKIKEQLSTTYTEEALGVIIHEVPWTQFRRDLD